MQVKRLCCTVEEDSNVLWYNMTNCINKVGREIQGVSKGNSWISKESVVEQGISKGY